MATYPLKNIAIGGNTYQIQGGEFYVVEIETQSTSASTFAAFPSKSHIINDSTVTVYDKDGNVQSSFDFTKLLSAPSMAHIITHGSGGNIDSYAGLIGVNIVQGSTYFAISFESDWKSPSSVATRYGVILEILNGNITALDGYALQVGGGGSGNILATLAVYKNGSQVPFANLSQSDTVELVDISTGTPISLDNNGLVAIIQSTPIIVKADTYYGYLSSYNTGSKDLCLVYANSSQMKALTLAYTWGTNWQVTSNKNLMTQ